MKEIMKCPICGAKNLKIYWSEYFGVVEDYYSCNHCGYFYEMAYSPYHEGIELMNNPIKIIKQIITLLTHFHEARKYKFSKSHF